MSNQILLSYVSTEDNKDAIINANNNISITLEKGHSISLSKLDLVLSNKTLPEYILPVLNKSTIGSHTYANSIYNYRITYCKTNGETTTKDINFKIDISNFSVNEDENGQLDNFNDCFKLSFPYFFSLLNKSISDTIEQELGATLPFLSSNNFKQLSPCFEANNDNITYYCLFKSDVNNTLRYYNNLSEFNNDINVGSYTFGFDEYIKNLLFREWETYKETDGFYYIKSNQLVNYSADEIKMTTNNPNIPAPDPTKPDEKYETYYIISYKSPHFYEYSSYIKSILYTIDGLNSVSMYLPINNKSYSLINNTTNINSSLNVISILQPNQETKGLYRLTYSNPDQKNNSCLCVNDITFNNISATLYYIDKYNNIEKIKLYKGDSITSVVCIQ